MIELGKTYRHPRNGREVRVLRNDPEVYEMELTLPPGLGSARPHMHLDFEQMFTVVEGRAQASIGRETRTFAAGDEMQVPRGETHVDVWNPGPDPAVVRNRLWPNPPFIRAFAETVLTHLCDGRLSDRGELPALQMAVIQHETAGESFAAGVPVRLQRALLPVLAAVGRRRGYTVEHMPGM